MSEPSREPDPDTITHAIAVPWHEPYLPKAGWRRAHDSWLAIVQLVVAATAGYAIARYLLHHEHPLLAVTVALSSLGLARDTRPRRVAEVVAGMLVGIALGETMRLVCGTGWWQIAVTLGVTLLAGRMLSPSPQFAMAAATQAAIALAMPLTLTPYGRLADGAVGGLMAIIVTALVPRQALTSVKRDAGELFGALDAAMRRTVEGLRAGRVAYAERGLEKARALQRPLDRWRESLDTASAVAQVSPLQRNQLPEFDRQQCLLKGLDLAVRNLRVVARRAAYLTTDEQQRPELAQLVDMVRQATIVVGQSVSNSEATSVAVAQLTSLAKTLDPARWLPQGASQTEIGLVTALRPLAVDLLEACGVSHANAAALLPRI